MQLVVLCGAKGSGKSETAKVLGTNYGFTRMSLGDPLKGMLATLPGVTRDHLYGHLKEYAVQSLGNRTPRYAMTSLGDGWGRGMMGKHFWVNILIERIKIALNCAQQQGFDLNIVVDDLRHPHDLAILLWYFPCLRIVRVHRPEVERRMGWFTKRLARMGLHPTLHASETYWDEFTSHFTILNTGDMTWLSRQVRNSMSMHMRDIYNLYVQPAKANV